VFTAYTAGVLVALGAIALIALYAYVAFYARFSRESLRFIVLVAMLVAAAFVTPALGTVLLWEPSQVVSYQAPFYVPYTTTVVEDLATTTVTSTVRTVSTVNATYVTTIYRYAPEGYVGVAMMYVAIVAMAVVLMAYSFLYISAGMRGRRY